MKPSRILLVHDDLSYRDRLSQGIKEWHRGEIVLLSDGQAALQMISAESFDIVLINVVLPGAHWGAIIEATKRKNNPPLVFVIAATQDVKLTEAIHHAGGFFFPRTLQDHWVMKMISWACASRKLLAAS